MVSAELLLNYQPPAHTSNYTMLLQHEYLMASSIELRHLPSLTLTWGKEDIVKSQECYN